MPHLGSSQGSVHFSLLQQWLHDCDENHANCRPLRSDLLSASALRPSRVIEIVSDVHLDVRLVESSALQLQSGCNLQYAALSYAWGSRQSDHYCTTRANYTQHCQGIALSRLPKTFRDAVAAVRNLGLRYLWIDALCIIQGADGDFETEAERMETVFSCAYVVLAASRANGVAEGFLGDRRDQSVVAIKQGHGEHVYLTKVMDDFQTDVIESSLNKRGWVLQERALARRTIFFTATQTYWECGHGVRCETLTLMNNKHAAFLGDPNFPRNAEKDSKGAQIRLYESLYSRYSTLEFSEPTDRPLAMAGLEARLTRAFATQGGFGLFEKYFRRGLLWRRADRPLTKIQFPPARAPPTWSWMAYQGAIDFMELPFDGVEWEREYLRSPWTPRPASSGHVHSTRSDSRDQSALTIVAREFTYSEGHEVARHLYYDEGTPAPGTHVKCVVVGISKLLDLGSPTTRRHYVLLVCEKPNSNSYERVGVGYLPRESIDFDKPVRAAQVY